MSPDLMRRIDRLEWLGNGGGTTVVNPAGPVNVFEPLASAGFVTMEEIRGGFTRLTLTPAGWSLVRQNQEES